MSYVLDELIEAVDFNTFRTDLLAVYDVGFNNSGYGQVVNGEPGISGPVVSTPPNNKVLSLEWTQFLDAADICTTHQGSVTTFPPNSSVEIGDLVVAEVNPPTITGSFDIPTSLTTLAANRLTAALTAVSVTAATNSRGPAADWSVQLIHQFRVTFAGVDDARYFFNSGGAILFSASRTGGAGSAQDLSWTALLDTVTPGTTWNPIFNHDTTTVTTGGTGAAIGYYQLSAGFQTLATLTDTGSYGLNTVTLEGRTVDGPGGANGDNGLDLEFRVTFTDGHTNAFSDVVTGTFTSTIDKRQASSLTLNSPVFLTNIPLTAGS